jgi:hypothetical protein
MLKREEKQLWAILRHLQRGTDYLRSARVAVAERGQNDATTTQHYSRADGSTLYEIDREIGSDLTGIWEAQRLLIALLDSQILRGMKRGD